MLPTYPANLLPRPFADNGIFQVIPDNKAAEGRASFKEGFPTETQLPLASGGIAPSRPDFNGILYMLSAMAFWQQSGGQWVYNAALDYNTPAFVFHNGMLWWCKAPNGPGTATPGAVEPGTNADYWIDFLSFLAGSQSGSAVGNPVGTVISFYGEVAPAGYLACDGSTFNATDYPKLFALLGNTAVLPDFRGRFIRGVDRAAVKDPDGATRSLASDQGDAIRNITGYVDTGTGIFSASGAFAVAGAANELTIAGTQRSDFDFDASRQVPTAPENRPVNVNLLLCIKHD